jgi:hypothetical protein
VKVSNHRRMARGGHGLPKVSPEPTMPYPSSPCGQATPQTALRSVPGWPACRASSLRPSCTPLDTPCHTPMFLTCRQPPWRRRLHRPLQVQGQFHDQGDAKWIVTSRSLWGHNNMPCGRSAPGRPIGRPGSGPAQGVMGVF